MSGLHDFEASVLEREQVGIVSGVTYILDDAGNKTKAFSGFVSVQLLNSNVSFNCVRWCNPLMGARGYGIVVFPERGDTVLIGFDALNRPYVRGMMLYAQAMKSDFSTVDYGGGGGAFDSEKEDVRLTINPGEMMIRGNNKTSLHFRNDGSTALKLDDTVGDTETLVVSIDANKNLTVTGSKNVSVTASGDIGLTSQGKTFIKASEAEVQANKVVVKSDDITLGTGAAQAIIRTTDRVQHIDPVIGVPVQSVKYITDSNSVKAS